MAHLLGTEAPGLLSSIEIAFSHIARRNATRVDYLKRFQGS
jgi:hypothetical protein